MTVFVEWLRATGRLPEASPQRVRQWWARAPEALLQAVAAFADAGPLDDPAVADLARRLLIDDERPSPT